MNRDRHRGSVAFRLSARLARREVLRRPGRTLLVALLVAVPVAAMVVGDVMVRTDHETPLQVWQQQYGQADFALTTVTPMAADNPLLKLLPKSHVVDGARGDVETRLLRSVGDRRSMAAITTMALADPTLRGIVQITSGRAPVAANEVFLTRTAARQLGVKVGETLHLVRPARRSFVVTGVGELAQNWGETEMVLPPAAPYPWPRSPGGGQNVTHLIDFPGRLSPAQYQRLAASPAIRNPNLQVSPAVVSSPLVSNPFDQSQFGSNPTDTTRKILWSWVIGAVVLTVAAIVIASAFATGARRQLVTLGQLAGNGASPAVLRRVLFLQGTFTGIIGALGGVGLGAAALAALAPHADSLFRKDVHPYIVRATDVVPIVVLGITAATVAALVPARTASRVPVLAALSGRRPLARVPRWLPITGLLAAAGGLALLGLAALGGRGETGPHQQVWALTAIVGGVSVLLGACAVAPFYVSVLEPVASRSRGPWRVATRSLARQRTRTSAVVSAIAAAAALAIAASSLVLAAHANANSGADFMRKTDVQLSTSTLQGGPDAAPPRNYVAAVAKVLEHSTRFQLLQPDRKNVSFGITAAVLDRPVGGSFVELLTGGEIDIPDNTTGSYFTVAIANRALIDYYGLSESDQQQLAAHGALLIGTDAASRGRATLEAITHVAPRAVPPPPRRMIAPIVDGSRYHIGTLPSVLLTPAAATALDMATRRTDVVLRARHSLTSKQRDQIGGITEDQQDLIPASASVVLNYQFTQPSTAVDPLLLEWLLVGLALALTLFVVAVNLALSATETRDERDVLTVAGAGPGAMSRTNGYKAALLTAMGALLAVPVGLLPVAVFLAASDRAHFALPVWVIAVLVLALPVAAGAVTVAASALALRIRPVRISTMAFD